jgi:hypothetical protein
LQEAFGRIVAAAEGHGVILLSSRDQNELDKQKAREIADEVRSIRVGGKLIDLDDDLIAIAEVARWCARASDESWMTIKGIGSARWH